MIDEVGAPCARCDGKGRVRSLGPCVGPVYDDHANMRKIPCPFEADMPYQAELLCDGHALAKALELGKQCPSCGGDPSRGMHRGEVIGMGKVMTCASSQAQADLQDVSDQLTLAGVEVVSEVEDDDEDASDGWRYGLTDGERNPSM